MTLTEYLATLQAKRYSGVILLHFQNGFPRQVDLPKDRIVLRAEDPIDRSPSLRSE